MYFVIIYGTIKVIVIQVTILRMILYDKGDVLMKIQQNPFQFHKTNRSNGNSLSQQLQNSVTQNCDTCSISPQGKATQANQVNQPSATAQSSSATKGSVASDFDNTADYHAYLKDTYPSITNSNIKISDTVLQQAMSDPAKEKVLTEFLAEMDGAMDFRASQIAGLSDATHNYKLSGFSITLDSIAEDNSGVIGSDFNQIVVSRKDGKAISDDEFEGMKTNVDDLFKQLAEQRASHLEEMTKQINQRTSVQRNSAKEDAAERLAERLEKIREARKEEAQEEALSLEDDFSTLAEYIQE